jgi:site-specific DNA recombinase
VPAPDLEALIIDQIINLLLDQHRLHDLVSTSGGDLATVQRTIRAGRVAEARLRDGTTTDRNELIRSLTTRVALSRDGVSIELSPEGVFALLGLDLSPPDVGLHLVCDAVRVRQGHEIRLVIPSATTTAAKPPSADVKLIALLAEAHVARELILANPHQSLNALAAKEGRCRTRLKRLLEISYLAPSITISIINGQHPAQLDHRKLLQVDLPMDWARQRAALGFA